MAKASHKQFAQLRRLSNQAIREELDRLLRREQDAAATSFEGLLEFEVARRVAQVDSPIKTER
jgi:hypothetical protein